MLRVTVMIGSGQGWVQVYYKGSQGSPVWVNLFVCFCLFFERGRGEH